MESDLVVGAADDPVERAADRAADGVVRRLAGDQPSAVEPAPAARIRRSATGALPVPVEPEIASKVTAMRGRGRPIAPPMRREMEQGFGTDLSDVRFHDGAAVDRLNQRLSARAFTVGADVYFAGGVPDAATTEGQYVLAHELAHTLQDDRSATVRRINTPDAPKFRLGWDEEERTKTYRNHLLTLKWQLVNNKLKVSPEMDEVDALGAEERDARGGAGVGRTRA